MFVIFWGTSSIFNTSNILEVSALESAWILLLLHGQPDIFISEERMRIKKQQPRLIKIKTMKQTEASVSKVEYHQEAFWWRSG